MGIKLNKKYNNNNNNNDNLLKPRQASKSYPKIRWLLIVALVMLPFFYIILQYTKGFVFIRYPGFISYKTITVRSPVDGYINNLNVQLGQSIKKGEPVVGFFSPKINLELRYLYKEKKLLTNSLNYFSNESENSLIFEIAEAKKDIEATNKVYREFLKYNKQGTIISLQLEQSRLNWSNAKRLYYSLKGRLYSLKKDNRHINEVFYRRKLAEINRDININESLKTSLNISAKQNSRVISLDSYSSDYITKGVKVLTLSTNKNQRVVGFIPPKYAHDYIKGAKVKVYFPDKSVVPGVIEKKPSFVRRLPLTFVNPLAERNNQVFIIIKLESKLNRKYIYGEPVLINLK